MKLSEENKFFLKLSINIILVFGISIAYSFIIDFLEFQKMLDYVCPIYKNMKCDQVAGPHSRDWPIGVYHVHWGIRHWMLFFMNISLMVIQFIRIGFIINKYSKLIKK